MCCQADYRILRKVACIGGTPAVMTLARPKKAKASSEATKPKDATAKPASKPASKPAAQSTAKSNKTRRAASKAGAKKQAAQAATATPPAAAASTPPLPPGCEVPVYKIVHRGELDLGDFGLSRTDSVRACCSEAIGTRIADPLAGSAADAEASQGAGGED